MTCGPFELDRRTGIVRREGEALTLGQRATDLLGALLTRQGDVLTKGELMDAAWPGVSVEESNLSVQIAALRKALGPMTDGSDWIVTVPRIGYRFVNPAGGSAPPQPNRLPIAVLPFVHLSADPDQTFFADGLAEEIITRLGKVSGLLVITGGSSFAYRGEPIDVRKVAEELDVRYVLTGSVRTSGSQARMSIQLIEAETRVQLWADRHDRQLADIFAVQDEVARQVVAALELELSPAEAGQMTRAKVRNPDARELYLRGRATKEGTHLSLDIFRMAVGAFERALDLDPTYGPAYSQLASCYVLDYLNRWTSDPEASLREARRCADRGLTLEPDEAETHSVSALVAMVENDIETATRETEATLAINPNHAPAHHYRGSILMAKGEPLAAIEHMERAMRLDPSAHQVQIHHLGYAYFHSNKFETAAALFRERILLVPTTDMTRGALAATLGHLGKVDEARRVWAELMVINPSYSQAERMKRGLQWQPAERDRVLEGLRLAGLPAD